MRSSRCLLNSREERPRDRLRNSEEKHFNSPTSLVDFSWTFSILFEISLTEEFQAELENSKWGLTKDLSRIWKIVCIFEGISNEFTASIIRARVPEKPETWLYKPANAINRLSGNLAAPYGTFLACPYQGASTWLQDPPPKRDVPIYPSLQWERLGEPNQGPSGTRTRDLTNEKPGTSH